MRQPLELEPTELVEPVAARAVGIRSVTHRFTD
jgi:hypothetical protein